MERFSCDQSLLKHTRSVGLVVVVKSTKPAQHRVRRYFCEVHPTIKGIVVVRRPGRWFPGSGGDARGAEGGVTLVPLSGKHGKSSQMDDKYGLRSVSVDSQQWLDQAPKVVDALKRDSPVSIATWGGRELSGRLCDWEQTGLPLGVREPGDSSNSEYVFLPWSSIEQVSIREVSQRPVKFLPS